MSFHFQNQLYVTGNIFLKTEQETRKLKISYKLNKEPEYKRAFFETKCQHTSKFRRYSKKILR